MAFSRPVFRSANTCFKASGAIFLGSMMCPPWDAQHRRKKGSVAPGRRQASEGCVTKMFRLTGVRNGAGSPGSHEGRRRASFTVLRAFEGEAPHVHELVAPDVVVNEELARHF